MIYARDDPHSAGQKRVVYEVSDDEGPSPKRNRPSDGKDDDDDDDDPPFVPSEATDDDDNEVCAEVTDDDNSLATPVAPVSSQQHKTDTDKSKQ